MEIYVHLQEFSPASIFNGILIDVISNFIPNKLVTFDDKDPSMEYIKIKIGKSEK